MRRIGAVATGETLSASELSDGLELLNELLDSWSISGFTIPYVTREEFDLIPSQQSYTFGLTGDFNSQRPAKIRNAGILIDEVEYPLDILTPEQWSLISLKNIETSLPQYLYPEGTAPLETLNLWPTPDEANKLVIYSEKPFASIPMASISTEYSLPPGYQAPVVSNLALKMCPEFGREPSAVLIREADSTLAQVKRKNTKSIYMESDFLRLTTKNPFKIFGG